MTTRWYYGIAVIEMSPKQLCQSFFFIATCIVLFLNSIPSFRLRFISYGSRTSQPAADNLKTSSTKEDRATPETKPATNSFSQLMDYAASFQVSHSWFTHFYVLSVLSSIFWPIQIYSRGGLFEILASRQVAHDGDKQTMLTFNQIFIAWLFMTIQGTRRLYESVSFGKQSKSKMWCMHWILGLVYYTTMGISVWIEGSSKLFLISKCKSELRRYANLQNPQVHCSIPNSLNKASL